MPERMRWLPKVSIKEARRYLKAWGSMVDGYKTPFKRSSFDEGWNWAVVDGQRAVLSNDGKSAILLIALRIGREVLIRPEIKSLDIA